jgi:prepilin-type N-terminal cleavage/methylation domain-containing protein
MRTPLRLPAAFHWRVLADDRGFTLVEVMIALLLMTIGLLAAAGSFPALTQAALYGKDQTRATNLAQQEMEIYRNTVTSTLAGWVGDYTNTVTSTYFDQNGNSTTKTLAYFTRDVQIQYWTYNITNTAFVQAASPYVTPTGSYVFHISIVTHWPVHGKTAFVTGTTSGCVNGGVSQAVGLGCVTLSSFTTP